LTSFTSGGVVVPFATFKEHVLYLEAWSTFTKRELGSVSPEAKVLPGSGADELFMWEIKTAFKGRQAIMTEAGKAPVTVTLDPSLKFPVTLFAIRPVTPPVDMQTGTAIAFPLLSGIPRAMEWWHFQLPAGFKGKTWGQLVESIGFTREGLLAKESSDGVLGFFGIGYQAKELTTEAK
jgi:hypothetical protein